MKDLYGDGHVRSDHCLDQYGIHLDEGSVSLSGKFF